MKRIILLGLSAILILIIFTIVSKGAVTIAIPSENKAVEIKDFNGKLAIHSQMTDNSSIANTTFYTTDGKVLEKNKDLGYFEDSLVIGDTLYLAFTNAGMVPLNLNNPDFKQLNKNSSTSVYNLVTDGENVYYIIDNQICRYDKQGTETCANMGNDDLSAYGIVYYKDKLYVVTGDTSTTVLTIDPKTLKTTHKQDMDTQITNALAVNDQLLVETIDDLGFYNNGKFEKLDLPKDFYGTYLGADGKEIENPEQLTIFNMKSAGNYALISVGNDRVYRIDPKTKEVKRILDQGHIMYTKDNDAYLVDMSKKQNPKGNIIKFIGDTGEFEYIDNIAEASYETYFYY